MYCKIKYNVAENEDPNKTLYINPDCVIKILIDYIKTTLELYEQEIDLCNEIAELQHIMDYDPSTYATEILLPFATYFVVVVERSENKSYTQLTPLLSTADDKYIDYCYRLEKYLRRISCDAPQKTAPSTISNVSTGRSKKVKKDRKSKQML